MAHSFKLSLLRGTISLDDIPDVPDKALTGPPTISRASLIKCIVDPLEWDYEESDKFINPGESCNIAVIGDGTPFMWEIKADGFFLDADHLTQSGETTEVSRTLYCDENAYGSCAIKVTDTNGLNTFGYVTCTKDWI